MITFTYSTDAGHTFTHEFTHAFPKNTDPERLKPALFALGMASLVSFWKAILAPTILIKAGALNDEQIHFWETLYRKGLGEFFYVNQIDYRGLISIRSDPNAPHIAPSLNATNSVALVPFGGGKDSLVTGELLKRQNRRFMWYELQPTQFAGTLHNLSGVTNSIHIGRNVEKNFAPVMELVKHGAPNGHVPITSIYMMSAIVAAKAHGLSDVILSVERSASFGNVEYLGETVNHQYSKSFEFELMAHDYIQKYIDPAMRVFSLLRPWYEIRIIQEFVKYPQYFPHFMSCNRGLKTGGWCGDCAKCAFIFAGLSAFLPPKEVKSIFKMNLYDNEHLLELYKDLAGVGSMKPFDCVGTFEENMLALYLSGQEYRKAGLPLPYVLANIPIEQGKKFMHLLSETSGEHLIPTDYVQP